MSAAHGAVLAVTADGRVYWVMYDSELQPSDHIDHALLGKELFDRHHPVCSPDAPCPDFGVCVANTDFVNSAGTCTPQPPDAAREWCGGVTDVACDSGYRCEAVEGQAGRCVPRSDCTVDDRCPTGYVCTVEPQKLGGGSGGPAAGEDCITGSDGKPVCCHEIEPGRRWRCCDSTGACEETSTPPGGGSTGGGTTSGPACIPAGEDLCGGLHEAACTDGTNGPRRCVMNLQGMPVDVGICEKAEGEICHMPGQCAAGLVCSMSSQRCEAQCRTSADCRTNGGTAVCEFQGREGGSVCNPYSTAQCADDEVWSAMSGRCTTDQPANVGVDDRTGCDAGECASSTTAKAPARSVGRCVRRRATAVQTKCAASIHVGPKQRSALHDDGTRLYLRPGSVVRSIRMCQSGAYCSHGFVPTDGLRRSDIRARRVP